MKLINGVIYILMFVAVLPCEALADVLYKVQPGDELMLISNKFYGTHQKWRKILKANKEINPKALTVGEEITIPGVEDQTIVGPLPIREKKKELPIKEAINPEAFDGEKQIVSKKKKDILSKESVTYKELREEILSLREKNQNLREELSDHHATAMELDSWEEERDNLLVEIKDLRTSLEKIKDQKENIQNNSSLEKLAQFSVDQENILKEKTRILSHRMWVNKNENFNTCELKLQAVPGEKNERKIHDFIARASSWVGNDNVLINSVDNEIIMKLPGKLAYGVKKPRLNSRYRKKLSSLIQELKQLPYESLDIVGTVNRNFVKDEDGKTVSANMFILNQSMLLRRNIIENIGFDAAKIHSQASHVQYFPDSEWKSFNFVVKLKGAVPDPIKEQSKEKGASRAISSVDRELPKSLQNFEQEISMMLGEPTYSQIEMQEREFNLHLSRHYLFKGTSGGLTRKGRERLKKILDLFSRTNDSVLEISWYPGAREKDDVLRKTPLHIRAIEGLIDKEYKGLKKRVTFGMGSKYNPLKDYSSYKDDLYNKRVLFKLKPVPVGLRNLEL